MAALQHRAYSSQHALGTTWPWGCPRPTAPSMPRGTPSPSSLPRQERGNTSRPQGQGSTKATQASWWPNWMPQGQGLSRRVDEIPWQRTCQSPGALLHESHVHSPVAEKSGEETLRNGRCQPQLCTGSFQPWAGVSSSGCAAQGRGGSCAGGQTALRQQHVGKPRGSRLLAAGEVVAAWPPCVPVQPRVTKGQ